MSPLGLPAPYKHDLEVIKRMWKVIAVSLIVLCAGMFYLAMCLDDEDEQEEMLRSRAEHYNEDVTLP